MSGSTGGISTDEMRAEMKAIQEEQNANQVGLFRTSSENSFAQSMAQTLGQLAENSAKGKPQV